MYITKVVQELKSQIALKFDTIFFEGIKITFFRGKWFYMTDLLQIS